MTIYFPDPQLRAMLFACLRENFGFAPELDGVPTQYVAALIDNEKLNPYALVSELFAPWLTEFALQTKEAMKSMEPAEKADLLMYSWKEESLKTVPGLFYNFCVQSSGFNSGSKGLDVAAAGKLSGAALNLSVNVRNQSFAAYNSALDDMIADYGYDISAGAFKIVLNASVVALVKGLCTASVIEEDKSGAGKNKMAVKQFNNTLKFYVDFMQTYKAVVKNANPIGSK